MTFGSNSVRLCIASIAVILRVSGQPAALPNNFLQFKSQPEQYHFRSYHYDTSKPLTSSHQQIVNHDFTPKTRYPIYSDDLPAPLQPADFTTPNHPPGYAPAHVHHQKEYACTENTGPNKLAGLTNMLGKNLRPEARSFDPMTSASEIHQEVCEPPKILPHSPPPKCESSPTKPDYQNSQVPKPTHHNILHDIKAPPSKCDCPTKPEHQSSQLVPAPKPHCPHDIFHDPKASEQFSKTPYTPVSPLYASSKHEPVPETPCSAKPPPCAFPKTYDYEVVEESKVIKPIVPIPAEKPILHNPFSEVKQDKIIPLPHPKGILHHRLHADEVMGYPEAYARQSDVQLSKAPPQVSQVVHYPGPYQTVGGVLGQHLVYPYVPYPPTKPIPLVLPHETEIVELCDDHDYHRGVDHYYRDVDDYHGNVDDYRKDYYKNDNYKDEGYHKNDKSWSRGILRNIADKMGVKLDDDYSDHRFSSRRDSYTDRGYNDDRHGRDRLSGKYSKHNREYYDDDYDERYRERNYSRDMY